MHFSASHTFNQPFDDVSSAFLDADAHITRYALTGAFDIEIRDVESDPDALTLSTVRTVEGEVPKLAKKLISAKNTIVTDDRWQRATDGSLQGTSVIRASAVPGTATINAAITPASSNATTYEVTLDLALDVPLLGERFVALLRPQVMEILDNEFDAWDAYLSQARHDTPAKAT